MIVYGLLATVETETKSVPRSHPILSVSSLSISKIAWEPDTSLCATLNFSAVIKTMSFPRISCPFVLVFVDDDDSIPPTVTSLHASSVNGAVQVTSRSDIPPWPALSTRTTAPTKTVDEAAVVRPVTTKLSLTTGLPRVAPAELASSIGMNAKMPAVVIVIASTIVAKIALEFIKD